MESRPKRQRKDSAKVNLTFSLIFHGLIVFVIVFWAAHEGVLGIKLKEITVAIVPKEKPPEPEKPPPPKIEPPKEESPKVEPPPQVAATPPPVQAAPPPDTAAPVVAPAAASLPDFAFGDGAKVVGTSTNAPVAYYKNMVEYTLRSNWERPTDLADDHYVAEVEIQVDGSGRITGTSWKKGSGDARWDASVKKAIASTPSINRPPPAGFAGKFLVRFDVLPATTELLLQ